MGFLCLSIVGCVNPDIEHPGEEPPQENPAPAHPSAPAGTSLLLQVVDDSGNPVAGAAVSSQGAVFSVDSSGHLLLEQLPPGRLLARVDALGFTSATAVVELQEGAHAGARVKLLPLPNPIPFQAEQGGTIQTPQVRVTIPPDAVVDALGQPVTGTVNVTIVPLDPTTQLAAMPGPLEATRVADGATVQLESFFMAEVSLWSNGAPVQLASGKSATLEFVLPEALASQFHVGDSVPAWWFDLDEGQWREEGEGRIQPSSTQPDRLAWIAQVKHFTWWNCDAPWTDKSCVNVLVVDEKGAPVKDAVVRAEGVSYPGASWAESTGADGRACIEIKRGNTANIFAGLADEPASGAVTVTGTEAAAVCGSGPCTEVRLTLSDTVICEPGAYETCAYPGPAGTEGKGVCRAGRRQCNVLGTEWSACRGQVLPNLAENCRTPFDDDCDGAVNEECSCSDQEGSPCYGGASDTLGVGVCRAGTVACDKFGNVVCEGQRLPRPETCSTLEDDNCNGVNEGCEPVSQWLWAVDAKGTSCTSSTGMLGMDVDGEGNTLILSEFSGTTTIGGEVFTGDEDDLLLVKVDARGQPVWAKLLDIYSSDSYYSAKESITVDAMGGVVVSGSFVGPLRIDGLSLLNEGSSHVFVARFAPNGRLLWAQQFPAEGDGLGGGAVATDAAGNVLLLARYGYDAIYVAKLDAGTGAPLWSRSIRNLGTLYYAISLDTDEAGNVLLVVNRYPVALVMKLEGLTGKELWARSAGLINGEGGSPPYLKVAGAGSVLVLMNNGSGETILSKLSADGDELWSHIITDWGVEDPRLGVDAAGNALVTGTFKGTIDLGGGSRQSTGPAAFVAWYDPEGRYLKDHVFPSLRREVDGASLGSSQGIGAGVDPEGNLLLGGSFADTVDFGMGRVSTCSYTSFVVKLDPTPRHSRPFQAPHHPGHQLLGKGHSRPGAHLRGGSQGPRGLRARFLVGHHHGLAWHTGQRCHHEPHHLDGAFLHHRQHSPEPHRHGHQRLRADGGDALRGQGIAVL